MGERWRMPKGYKGIVHIFDNYHDYTCCGLSAYDEKKVGHAKLTMRGLPRKRFCKECVKNYLSRWTKFRWSRKPEHKHNRVKMSWS